MHIYNESTSRQKILSVKINWSRELAFSERQINWIDANVPKERGVYCIYAKDYSFDHRQSHSVRKKWSPIIYIGSGWLNRRLRAHLDLKKNPLLVEYFQKYDLAFRFDRIVDEPVFDWPKTVEALLLNKFAAKFGGLPPANRRNETIRELEIDKFFIDETGEFSLFA